MAVRVERIRQLIEAIAALTQTPGGGASRPTFSSEWGKAIEYVKNRAEEYGCAIRIDSAGNLHARPRKTGWEQPAWLCGSHVDSVPNGGDYDGVAGVVVAMELLASSADDGIENFPLELIVFAEEEGTTFSLGMLGSRAWVGQIGAAELGQQKNSKGESYLQAGAAHGVVAEKLPGERLRPSAYRGFIEVHIEQGPGMWRRGERVAVVKAIAGRRQYRAIVTGEANHAGAAAMNDRRDALAGAAELVLALEDIALAEKNGVVLTVGKLQVHPNAVNVIPDRVEFSIDLRAGEDSIVARCDEALRARIDEICERRQLRFTLEESEAIAATPMDSDLCAQLAESGGGLPLTVSGALHDAAVIAPHIPTAMLFVPSRGGISHNPAEFSRVEDIAMAAECVQKVVRRVSVRTLNAMDIGEFTAICGRFFENSPWIAQRSWKHLPFASRLDLHEKMCGVVKAAGGDAQVELIRAHPDLVGRLAREGRLGTESTAEQAAAGLTELSGDEAEQFERLNAEYRQKFDFPFVICARQNRKEAILAAFPRRLKNDRAAEIATALSEIYKIAHLRLLDAIGE